MVNYIGLGLIVLNAALIYFLNKMPSIGPLTSASIIGWIFTLVNSLIAYYYKIPIFNRLNTMSVGILAIVIILGIIAAFAIALIKIARTSDIYPLLKGFGVLGAVFGFITGFIITVFA